MRLAPKVNMQENEPERVTADSIREKKSHISSKNGEDDTERRMRRRWRDKKDRKSDVHDVRIFLDTMTE